MAKPMIVGEKKRETKELPPPNNLSFVHLAGKMNEETMKKYLAMYLK